MAVTIFMIHGMWGGGWYWDNYKAYFEDKGYECISPICGIIRSIQTILRPTVWAKPVCWITPKTLKLKSTNFLKNPSSWGIPWAAFSPRYWQVEVVPKQPF